MDTFIDALRLHVLISIPQTYITWSLVFSFLWPQPSKLLVRVLILAFMHAVYTDIFVLIIPPYLSALNSLLALFVLLHLLFKDFKLRQRILLYVGIIVLSIVSDTLSITIAQCIGIPDLESIRRDHLSQFLPIVYTQLLLFAIAGWYIRRRKSRQSLNRLFANFSEKKPLLRVFALIVSQFVMISMIIGVQYSFDNGKRLVTTVLIYLLIVISIAAILFMLRLLTLTRAEAIRSTQAVYVDDIHNMFASVRGQRHDFLNHVQVLHALAQMGKYEQLKSYTANLVQETREVSDIINHAAPALAAFAQAKTTVAIGLGISIACELPERWNVPDSAINMLDIIKILGNLVDNAIDETNLLPMTERAVRVSISTDVDGITMEVSNRGRPIDDDTRVLIMQAGFSTKGEGHSGLGLAIVQERIIYYGGTLDIKSDRATRMTTFIVRLPCEAAFIEDQPAS